MFLVWILYFSPPLCPRSINCHLYVPPYSLFLALAGLGGGAAGVPEAVLTCASNLP